MLMCSLGAGDLSEFTQAGSTSLDEYWMNYSGNGAGSGFGPGRLQKANRQDSGCGIYPRWKLEGRSCPGPTPAQIELQWPAKGACSALVNNRNACWYKNVSRFLATLFHI